jgi:HPt (histidine-containing phosphotransfer) domain-containing protein
MTTESPAATPSPASPGSPGRAPDPTPAAPPPQGGIEKNLRLLARAGLAMFLALTATLFFVQFMLGRQLDNLEERGMGRLRTLNGVESSVGALFRRQAQILSSTSGDQLKPLADRQGLETRLRESSALLASSAPGPETAALKNDVAQVLETDQQLFESMVRRHELQATFETQLADVNQQLRSTIEQTHGILGYAQLDFIRLLRRLNVNAGNAGLVREVVLGDRRAQEQLASDLASQILTLGVLVGKIGLATTPDALNSIMANEIAQNITATRDKLEQLTALVANAPEIATRAQALRKTYDATIPRIATEDNTTSMISLRRSWFAQRKKAEALRAASVEGARVLTANVAVIQTGVLADGEHAVARADRTIWFTRTLSLLLLAGGVGISVFAARRIRVSVGELRESNRALEDLKEKLVAINGNLEGLVDERTRALAARERSMRLVLDNTGDGLIPTSLDGTIKGEVSLAAREWLGTPTPSHRVWDYLYPDDPAGAAQFRMTFSQIADDIVPFEVYADQMPTRFKRDGRIVSLGYKQIREGETPVGVLVVLRDITAQLEAERREGEARELQAFIGHILRSPQGFRTFLDEANALTAQLLVETDLVTVKRALHTMKGNCAVYGLASLAKLCHEMEDQLIDRSAFSPAEGERLQRAWQQVLGRVSAYVERDKTRVELGPDDLATLREMLNGRIEHRRILQIVDTWHHEPVQFILDRLSTQAKRIAAALGKEVEVQIDTEVVRSPDQIAPFWASLVHVVRNSIDHGIEMPAEREEKGKVRAGHLRLSAKRRPDDHLEVEVFDDGTGMNFAKLEQRARAMKLPHGSEQDLLQAVFADGLSTRDAVTELSGRGVGLGAVRAACEAVGGRITVRSGTAGTAFTFVLPLDLPAPAPGPEAARAPTRPATRPPAA